MSYNVACIFFANSKLQIQNPSVAGTRKRGQKRRNVNLPCKERNEMDLRYSNIDNIRILGMILLVIKKLENEKKEKKKKM